ncbi:MAG: sporulation protein YunB [Clostridiales bacterium]|nr:sporulation protein YunB [Clostridiales bacterium]
MKKRRVKLFTILLAMLILFVAGFLYINVRLGPVLEGLSAARVESLAAKVMNDAILEVLGSEEAQKALINIYSSERGVYLLMANSARLNVIAADCAASAQQRIMALGEQGISIPVGTLSGVPTFAGMGPNIKLKFTPAGAVRSSFSSEFRSAGINQTLHRITLKLVATLRVILPGKSYSISVVAEAPIAESIIVGDVPNAYTNLGDAQWLTSLVPGEP